MPKQKVLNGAEALSSTFDPRFSNFTTDPRFRLPSKRHTRTKIDKRFSRMLKDEDFSNTATVDRYGRKLSSSHKRKALEKLYLPDDEESEEDEDEEATEEADIEVEDDDAVEKELKRVEIYDPARGGGFSSSDEDEDNEEEKNGGVGIEDVEFPDMQAEAAAVEMGEVSSRFAVVNLDWDNIKSTDLMVVFSSFVKPGGKIHKISIYPSEFGKERIDREEMEGPPREIFTQKEEDLQAKDSEDGSDDEDDEKIKKQLLKEDTGKEFDDSALRQYQLERLRYYYAVVVCSDKETAQGIYESTDGTEYLSSANFFDLRFIPDGVEFDDKPRDECSTIPSGYRPTEFVTDALQHSKVKLTWDTNPEEATRKDAINRAFSGSRTEIGENDLRAYLGSDSESEIEPVGEGGAPSLSKKELARLRIRETLGLSEESKPSKTKGGPVGDMEITFTAGLTLTEKGNVFENEPIVEETTTERYVRLEKERKARRKEKAKAKRNGHDPSTAATLEKEPQKEDLGFDDPFFATDEAVKSKKSKSQQKEARLAKREAKAAEAIVSATQRAELELLMQEPTTENGAIEHFDINEIARAEKVAKKKGKKGKDRGGKRGGLQEGFKMDVGDERFGKVFESHEFAIDPSHPKFMGTEGMKKLLEEGRRKRGVEGSEEVSGLKSKRRKGSEGEASGGDLSGLVEKVKKKTRRQ